MSQQEPDEPLIDLLGSVIGAAATLRLLALFGGTDLYVPASVSDDHVLTKCLGVEAAKRLSARFAGDKLKVPRGEDDFTRLTRVRRVAGLLRAGTPPADIALLIGVHPRQVRNYRVSAEEMGLLPLVFDESLR